MKGKATFTVIKLIRAHTQIQKKPVNFINSKAVKNGFYIGKIIIDNRYVVPAAEPFKTAMASGS